MTRVPSRSASRGTLDVAGIASGSRSREDEFDRVFRSASSFPSNPAVIGIPPAFRRNPGVTHVVTLQDSEHARACIEGADRVRDVYTGNLALTILMEHFYRLHSGIINYSLPSSMNRPPRFDPSNIIGRVKNGSLDNIGVFRVIYLGRLHSSDPVEKKKRNRNTQRAFYAADIEPAAPRKGPRRKP